MTDLRFHARVTPDLFIKAQHLHMGRRWVALLVVPIGVGSWIFFGPYSELSSLATKLAAFPLTFAFPALMYWWTRRQWLRLFHASPYADQVATGSIAEDGVHLSSHGDVTIPWQHIIKLRYQPDLMLLYQSPASFQILSREFFDDDAQWKAAVAYVTRRLSPSAARS